MARRNFFLGEFDVEPGIVPMSVDRIKVEPIGAQIHVVKVTYTLAGGGGPSPVQALTSYDTISFTIKIANDDFRHFVGKVISHVDNDSQKDANTKISGRRLKTATGFLPESFDVAMDGEDWTATRPPT